MIIRSVRARNILKYAQLELSGLPERGLIAISGPNESGKTAVVETICFALFGRTFSLPAEDIVKVIRWGEAACDVDLEFSVGESERYRISRSLSREGVHGATLHRSGVDAPIASGAADVLDEVVRLGGFSFQQYLDSLYLAQREISAPHSQSETIKAVAGGMSLEQVSTELQGDIRRERHQIEDIEAQAEVIRERIRSLGLREEGMGLLESEKARLGDQIEVHEGSVAGLRKTSADLQAACEILMDSGRDLLRSDTETSYSHWRRVGEEFSAGVTRVEEACQPLKQDHVFCEAEGLKGFLWEYEGRLSAFDPALVRAAELRRDIAAQLGEPRAGDHGSPSLPKQHAAAEKALGRTLRWRWLTRFNLLVMLLLASAAWAAWYLLVQRADTEAALLMSDWLGQYVPDWENVYLSRLLPGAAFLGLFALALMVRTAYVSRRVAAARARCGDLANAIASAQRRAAVLDALKETPFPRALQSVEAVQDPHLDQMVETFVRGPGEALLAEDGLESLQDRLRDLLQSCDIQLRDLREAIAAQIGGLEKEREGFQAAIAGCERDLVREQDKHRLAQELEDSIDALCARVPGHQGQIRLLECAQALVRGTCQDLYSRFNRVLRRYTGEVMPLLTEQRYQHMLIDAHLNVRVFSTDKNDFAGLDELSSGTQRQIMLAVRLAMAKALAEAAVRGIQFVILDEPFAFFDRERIRSTLKALRGLDARLAQNWIISQEFESDDGFALRLNCSRDVDELAVRATEARLQSA